MKYFALNFSFGEEKKIAIYFAKSMGAVSSFFDEKKIKKLFLLVFLRKIIFFAFLENFYAKSEPLSRNEYCVSIFFH